MAVMNTEKKPSPFTAKGKECPTPSLDMDVLGASGDAELGSDSETTEMVQIRKDAEALVRHWAQDVPATPEDVTSYTIDRYFGKGWKGSFPECREIVYKKSNDILTQIGYYASMADYISNLLTGQTVTGFVASLIPAEAFKMYSHFQTLSADWMNIQGCISEWKDFKFSVQNPMDVFNSADAVLAKLEHAGLVADKTVNDIIDVYDTVAGWLDSKDGTSIAETVSEKLSNLVENVGEKLANLPESVMNAFMNCQFIQNMFSLPRRILTHCAAVIAIVTSIRSPTCLKDFVKIIQTLRQAVAEMKNCAATIQNAVQQVQNIKNMITQGNWIGVLGQLNQGKGSAKQAFNIVEHPSSFAAKYPANSSYTTHGGHIVELDNTKGHERIHVQHKAGTSVEMSPEGDMHSKVKKNFQLMVDGDIEINSNKKVTITGKDGVKIDYGGTTFQMDKTSMGMGGQSGNMNMDKMAVTSESASIVSATTLTMGSALETSVSATGLLSLSSAVAVKIQAPIVSIIAEGPGIMMESMSGMIAGAATAGVGFISTANTMIVAAKTGMYAAGAANMIGAGVNIIGGPGGA